MKASLLLIIAAISAMGQNLKLTVSVVHTEKQNPLAGASYVALPDKIQFSFPDGTSYHFPRYDLFEAKATMTFNPSGTLWHYELAIANAKTSEQPIRWVAVRCPEGIQFANVTSTGWDDTPDPNWYGGAIQPGGAASFSFDSNRELPMPIEVSLTSKDISTNDEMGRWEWPQNTRYIQFIVQHIGTVGDRNLLVTATLK